MVAHETLEKCKRFTLGLALTFASQLGCPPPPVVAQGVKPGDQQAAGQEGRRPLEAAWIEVRSVISNTVPGAFDDGKARKVTYGLRYTDFDRVMATVPSIRKALLVREIPTTFRHLENVFDGWVVGTTQDYAGFSRLEVDRGRFLARSDDDRQSDHAVLGSEAAKALFPNQDPVGQLVKIGSETFTVVGVAKPLSEVGLKPQGSDKNVYIPLKTSRVKYGDWIVSAGDGRSQKRQISRIIVQVQEDVKVEEAARLIDSALKPFHPMGGVEVVIVRPGVGSK